MIKDKGYYLGLFQVSEQQLDGLASEGLRGGGSYCDLFFENTEYHELLLRDGIVSSGGFHVDFGVGIRVLKGERTGYAYSESTDARSMAEAVKAATLIAQGGNTSLNKPPQRSEDGLGRDIMTLRQALDSAQGPDRYPFGRDWREAEARTFVPYMERLQQKISSADRRAIKVIVSLSDQVSDILMFNSLGELTFDTRPMGTIAVSVVFSQDGKIENKTVSRSYRKGVEMLTDALLEEIAAEAVAGIDERFAARRPKGGQMPVVMGAGASGILLHEAMGHAFEADFNRKGQSIFSGRIGEKVCSSDISIVDDGTIPGNRGSVNFDDEGVPGQKTYMVSDGILTSYLHDRISAGYYGVSPTGNGRRETFRYAPIPRMRSTYMLSGS